MSNSDDVAAPDLPGAPGYFQDALRWQADLESERRKAGTRREQQITDLTRSVSELRRDQAAMAVNLEAVRIEFNVLRKEVASVGGRVDYQGDELHKLRTRVDQMERELSEMKTQITYIENRCKCIEPPLEDTVPPPSAAATLKRDGD
jgi:chromosome segregation ATPase